MVENLGIGKLYENKVGLYLFNVFFPFCFLSFMEYCWPANFLFVCIFQLTAARIARDKKEINKFHALANSQERRKRKQGGYQKCLYKSDDFL